MVNGNLPLELITSMSPSPSRSKKMLLKGKEIAIEGKLTNRSYETESGEKKYVTEVIVTKILMLGR